MKFIDGAFAVKMVRCANVMQSWIINKVGSKLSVAKNSKDSRDCW